VRVLQLQQHTHSCSTAAVRAATAPSRVRAATAAAAHAQLVHAGSACLSCLCTAVCAVCGHMHGPHMARMARKRLLVRVLQLRSGPCACVRTRHARPCAMCAMRGPCKRGDSRAGLEPGTSGSAHASLLSQPERGNTKHVTIRIHKIRTNVKQTWGFPSQFVNQPRGYGHTTT
jgi:hypothetical protein